MSVVKYTVCRLVAHLFKYVWGNEDADQLYNAQSRLVLCFHMYISFNVTFPVTLLWGYAPKF